MYFFTIYFLLYIKYDRTLSEIHFNVTNRLSQLFALNHINFQRFPL